ncbi:MAG TPA: hypothetical protein DDW36_01510 [Candidatus Magasanikbacteria bacterium]|nr:hypothetical protein [Candidatus Magasanikbacteria bacterium]
MQIIQHKTLAQGRWFTLSLAEQLGNVGSEVGRAAAGQKRGDKEKTESALDRALELLDLTLEDSRWQGRRKEIARSRELLCAVFYNSETYNTTPADLEKYFFQFALAARKNV